MLYVRWVFKDFSTYPVFLALLLITLYGFKLFSEPTPFQIALGILYSTLLALVGTCLYKTLKEKVKEGLREKNPIPFLKETANQIKEGEFLKALKGISAGLFKVFIFFAGILGLGAVQFCAFGSPVCGFSVGAAIVTALFPAAMVQILYEYANWIVLGAILLQALGLYFMGCFKRVTVIENN